MKIISIQEAFKRKFERQKNIKELEYHASGHCVHIGKISPGCHKCFVPERYNFNINCGAKCNLNCTYCTSDRKIKVQSDELIQQIKTNAFALAFLPDKGIPSVSFSGGGEPLLYIDIIAEYMKFFRDIEEQSRKKPWYYIYTNGVLANLDMILKLQDIGIDEIRFHLGAADFSKKVYKNMINAVRHLKVVTVETPAWPPHRKKLIKMLPIIEDIGVKHLNIGEVEIIKPNFKMILQALPDAEIYQCFDIHLFDGDLVYDLIEEVIRRSYSYSVVDCNGLVKSIQRAPGKWIYHEDVKGLCAKY